jgi:hypothetical protein
VPDFLQGVTRNGSCDSKREVEMRIATIEPIGSHEAHAGLHDAVLYLGELARATGKTGDFIDCYYIKLSGVPGRQEGS